MQLIYTSIALTQKNFYYEIVFFGFLQIARI
jgi:hypothetical protein